MKWVGLLAGGVAGTAARYLLGGFVYQILGASFPYGTLVVNLVGCFLIGFLAVLAEEKFLLGPNARVFLMIGFCGAFTTFSTFILESYDLIRDGELLKALGNVVGSVVLGFLVFKAGMMTAEVI